MGHPRPGENGRQAGGHQARRLRRRQLRRIALHAPVGSGGRAAAPGRGRRRDRGRQSRRPRHRSAQLLLSHSRRGAGAPSRRRPAFHLCRQRFHGARPGLLDMAAPGRRIARRLAGRLPHAADQLADRQPPRPGGVLQLAVEGAGQRRSAALGRRHRAPRRTAEAHRGLRQDLPLPRAFRGAHRRGPVARRQPLRRHRRGRRTASRNT